MRMATAMPTVPKERRTERPPKPFRGWEHVYNLRARPRERTKQSIHTSMILAEVTGNIASAAGLIAAAIAVGLIGTKAAEAVGRNPAASGKILVQSILGMALAEGLGLLALFMA
jgi:F-type H+-transporting ATPase subunit c